MLRLRVEKKKNWSKILSTIKPNKPNSRYQEGQVNQVDVNYTNQQMHKLSDKNPQKFYASGNRKTRILTLATDQSFSKDKKSNQTNSKMMRKSCEKNRYKTVSKSPYDNKQSIQLDRSIKEMAGGRRLRDKLNLKQCSKSKILRRNQNIKDYYSGGLQKVKLQSAYQCHFGTRYPSKQKFPEKIEFIKQNFVQGKYKQCQKMLRVFLQDNPNHMEALTIMSQVCTQIKKFSQAIKFLNNLSDLQYSLPMKYLLLLIQCHLELGNLEIGAKYIQLCIKNYPKSVEGYLYAAKMFNQQRKYTLEQQYYLKCLEINPQRSQVQLGLAQNYYRQKNYQEAIKFYKLALNKFSKTKMTYLLKLANCLEKINGNKQALKMLRFYLKQVKNLKIDISEKQLQVMYKISWILFQQNELESCLMQLEQMLAINNNYLLTKVIRMMVVIYIKQNNFYAAHHLLGRTHQISIYHSQLMIFKLFCQGVVSLMKKKINEAFQSLLQVQNYLNSTKIVQNNKEFKNHSNKNNINHNHNQQQVSIDDFEQEYFVQFIKEIFHLYFAYGYICQNKIELAKKHLEQQIAKPTFSYLQPGLYYNYHLCSAILYYRNHDYSSALNNFQQSLKYCPNKAQSYLYISIVFIKQYMINSQETIWNHVKQNMECCLKILNNAHNNFAGTAHYIMSIIYCEEQQWSNALSCIDQAIEKSEQNQFGFFYLRSIIMACMQNYKQAIQDASVAINLDDEDANVYLLRSRCLQIDGNSNQAFIDLQSYISLKPDDPQIHFYAGHLLFQNGAFEDTLLAYGQLSNHQDVNVFLTRSKTYFLLGQFQKAVLDMEKVVAINPQEYVLDYNILILIKQLLSQYTKEASEYIFDPNILKNSLKTLIQIQNQGKYGRIFRINEICTLKAVCYFYLQDYSTASEQFIQSIKLKNKSILQKDDQEQDFEQQYDEKCMYINQMTVNLAICYLMLKKPTNAKKCLQKCIINEKAKLYHNFTKFMEQLKSQKFNNEENYDEVFPQTNKLSKYIPSFQVHIGQHNRQMKLCLPYPKVEPPEISPKFDRSLLENLDIDQVQRKPEAPWIQKQDGSIKFTDHMQVYSRLQLSCSQVSQDQQSHHQMGQQKPKYMQDSYKCLKDKLKLDKNVEIKLHRLIGCDKAQN